MEDRYSHLLHTLSPELQADKDARASFTPQVFAVQVRKGASDLSCFLGFSFLDNKKQCTISLCNGLLLSLYGKQTGQFSPTGKNQHLHPG